MRTIVFEEGYFEELRRELLSRPETEQAAFLLCGTSETVGEVRWLVREVIPIPTEGFLVQEELRLTIDATFSAAVLARAEHEQLSVILTHSHPFDERLQVHYSLVDDRGEQLIFRDIHTWVTGRRHASMVFGQKAMAAREWSADGKPQHVDRVVVIGKRVRIFDLTSNRVEEPINGIYDRQVRAFGVDGQRKLARLRVGIVGLGGTGSLVNQQLAHLGIGCIIGIDDDSLEDSNHSRVVGSLFPDIEAQTPKVEIAARLARSINPGIEFEDILGSVADEKFALELRRCDVVFCCTDNQWSRAILNQMAQQYLIPVIDMGVRVVTDEKGSHASVKDAGGRVYVIRPGKGCLLCIEAIRPHLIAQETLPAEEREKQISEGYIRGANIRNPAVISLNSVVAGLAVTEFLDIVTGFMDSQRSFGSIEWEILKGEVWRASEHQRDHCVCSTTGDFFAMGDGIRLPCRLPTDSQLG